MSSKKAKTRYVQLMCKWRSYHPIECFCRHEGITKEEENASYWYNIFFLSEKITLSISPSVLMLKLSWHLSLIRALVFLHNLRAYNKVIKNKNWWGYTLLSFQNLSSRILRYRDVFKKSGAYSGMFQMGGYFWRARWTPL